MADPAPVVLFAFARPDHTRRTLRSLAANTGADRTDLIVYSDAPRQPSDEPLVAEVRSLVRAATGFRSVAVVERRTNLGLARNIIEGVTEVIGERGRVIVLEDDIVTSPGFLPFMNAALDRYAGEPRVWHVSGWNYPIDPSGLDGAFFWRVMNCWGWATWADRWRYFEKNPRRLIDGWSRDRIRRFNLDGANDFWAQVLANHAGKKNTWAIFWYATLFERDGLCLNPARSYVRNIGNDGTGEHCPDDDPFQSTGLAETLCDLPDVIRESPVAVERVRAFYADVRRTRSQSFIRRALNFVRRL